MSECVGLWVWGCRSARPTHVNWGDHNPDRNRNRRGRITITSTITIRTVLVGKTDHLQSDTTPNHPLGVFGFWREIPCGECMGVWEYGVSE
jgi:hypothetical protein